MDITSDSIVSDRLVLLIGGAAESGPIAEALAANGFRVLVSTATDTPLELPLGRRVHRRTGKLDVNGIAELITDLNVHALVDASHPYAVEISRACQSACDLTKIPYFQWTRPAYLKNRSTESKIIFAVDHQNAAEKAFSFGKPVLLTIGSRNLSPYISVSRLSGNWPIVRVLDCPESSDTCKSLWIPEERVILGRGPFTTSDNVALIKRFNIGVIVTKDGGIAGGVPEKMEAARETGCLVIVIKRPTGATEAAYNDIPSLVEAILKHPMFA